MKRFEEFACGQVFHCYPESLSYEEIVKLCGDDVGREAYNDKLEMTANECEQLILCEQYENYDFADIPDVLGSFIRSCEIHFPELKDK